ncbi:unnamed protein product [Polarella glacialis]|uniref:Hexosyltransferase n=1 Tax=Polarella glacialis TaxID=89957 RepID=A0A813LKC5_POLGL|nr:unnamed protein product [Polarella glacialis]
MPRKQKSGKAVGWCPFGMCHLRHIATSLLLCALLQAGGVQANADTALPVAGRSGLRDGLSSRTADPNEKGENPKASDVPSPVASSSASSGASGSTGRRLHTIQLAPGLRATACSNQAHDGQLFAAVTSPVGNFNLRKALRTGHWLMSTFPPASRASYMFFVGRSTDPELQLKVVKEMEQFCDVVQFDVADTYMNLAIKSVGAAAWYASQMDLGKVRYWLKVEDYMSNDFAAIDALVTQLIGEEKFSAQALLYYGGGMVFGGQPVVPDGRWGCPKKHCPHSKYPFTYAGGQYLLSAGAVRILVSQGLPLLNLKDPYPVEDHFVASVLGKAKLFVADEKRLSWAGGKPYGAPSVVKGDFLLSVDTEERPEVIREGEEGVWEGSPLIIAPGEAVTKAWYGDPQFPWHPDHGKDVTSSVIKTMSKGHTVRADSNFGDPAPGKRKVLLAKVSAKAWSRG